MFCYGWVYAIDRGDEGKYMANKWNVSVCKYLSQIMTMYDNLWQILYWNLSALENRLDHNKTAWNKCYRYARFPKVVQDMIWSILHSLHIAHERIIYPPKRRTKSFIKKNVQCTWFRCAAGKRGLLFGYSLIETKNKYAVNSSVFSRSRTIRPCCPSALLLFSLNHHRHWWNSPKKYTQHLRCAQMAQTVKPLPISQAESQFHHNWITMVIGAKSQQQQIYETKRLTDRI